MSDIENTPLSHMILPDISIPEKYPVSLAEKMHKNGSLPGIHMLMVSILQIQ